MEKRSEVYIHDKGKMFALTKKGKETIKSFQHDDDCIIGKEVEDYENYLSHFWIDEGYFEEVDDPDWVTLPGFKVVHDYKGNQIQCGNPYVFYDREMAERYRKNYEDLYKSWGNDEIPYIVEAIYEGRKPKPNKEYQGKTLFIQHNWWGEIGKIGDLVEEAIAMDIANCVPPRTFTRNMIQCGEPASSAMEGNTYTTFVKIDDDVWEYKGDCLAGQTEQNWTPISIISVKGD